MINLQFARSSSIDHAAIDHMTIQLGIVTVSDRASRGEYEDRGGPAIREYFTEIMRISLGSRPARDPGRTPHHRTHADRTRRRRLLPDRHHRRHRPGRRATSRPKRPRPSAKSCCPASAN